ncbi:MAG: folate-binding protein [Pseudomonadota bacterium]
MGFVDERRALLAMTGADARAVLQGVVTNDVDQVAPGRAVYAALLTPQGKYLFDFFLLDGGDGGVLIDVAANRADALAGRLKMYCLRRDAAIAPVAQMGVGLVWAASQDGAAPPRDAAATLVPDPRHPALGWRLYAGDPAGVLDALTARAATHADYDALRVAHIVPEGGAELVPEDSFILEMGFERLSGVDFRKGCYVGQEVTARMKHKTDLRKGLVQVAVSGAAAPGTEIRAGGKPAGTLFTTSGDTGLAHLRYDRAGAGMQADTATVDYTSPEGPRP